MSSFGVHGIAHGDVLACLKELPSNEFDGLFCDPPYGFSFMGKAWDYDVPSVEVWRECLRVLKPGAPLLAFGGARTFHRICVGVEDAGFELRDVLMWLYGEGFPKSQNVSIAIDKAAGAERPVIGKHPNPAGNKAGGSSRNMSAVGMPLEATITAPATPLASQWDGYGTALKPAYEPIILARKPLEGTTAANVAKWGVVGLAIDACRIEGAPRTTHAHGNVKGRNREGGLLPGLGEGYEAPGAEGRWPANVLLDEAAAAALDATVGPMAPSRPFRANETDGAVLPMTRRTAGGYDDAGGPSRFYYCAKVSTKEREYGCEALPQRSAGEVTDREDGSDGLNSPRAGAGRGKGARNYHPTIKPISLTQYLARLILPPSTGAQLLIPYAGAGSEMIGALRAGWPLVFGVEGEADYIAIAEARIAAWSQGGPGRGGKAA